MKKTISENFDTMVANLVRSLKLHRLPENLGDPSTWAWRMSEDYLREDLLSQSFWEDPDPTPGHVFLAIRVDPQAPGRAPQVEVRTVFEAMFEGPSFYANKLYPEHSSPWEKLDVSPRTYVLRGVLSGSRILDAADRRETAPFNVWTAWAGRLSQVALDPLPEVQDA